jgi:hypothetical protein
VAVRVCRCSRGEEKQGGTGGEESKGRERASRRGGLIPSPREAVALIAAESGDQGCSTELLAVSRKTTSREDGLGISWAESGLAFGPDRLEAIFL